MSDKREHNDAIRELIARGLEGELSGEDRRYLEEHPEVQSEIDETIRMRGLLSGAVDRIPIPDRFAESIRAATIDADEIPAEPSTTGTGEETGDGSGGRFWIYSLVASITFVLMIWGALGLFKDEPESPSPIASSDTGRTEQTPPVEFEGPAVREILQVGMTDHMRCALTFFTGEVPPLPEENLKMGIGEEFEMLVPIVQEKIDLARLVVAHHCSFEGREYTHMVLKGEGDTLISLAITRRLDGEHLQGRPDADSTVDGRSLFRTEIEGYEIAGFESGDYLVFLASNLSVEDNLRTISKIVGPVSQVVGT